MKIFISNLCLTASKQQLTDLFSTYGQVVSTTIIPEEEPGAAINNAIVEMAEGSCTTKAIADLHGKHFMGYTLTVKEGPSELPLSQDRPGTLPAKSHGYIVRF